MDVCGVLPIFDRGTTGRPYVAALASVEPDALLLDYAFRQYAAAGIERVYVPISSKELEWFARLIGYSRGGVPIEYVEILPGESQEFYHYAVRGCRYASRRADYTRYLVLNPCVRVADPKWLAKLVSSAEAPAHLGIADGLYLDEGTVTKLRAACRIGEGEKCLAESFGPRWLAPPKYLDLSKWEDVRTWYLEG
jgi:hypothetical protein